MRALIAMTVVAACGDGDPRPDTYVARVQVSDDAVHVRARGASEVICGEAMLFEPDACGPGATDEDPPCEPSSCITAVTLERGGAVVASATSDPYSGWARLPLDGPPDGVTVTLHGCGGDVTVPVPVATAAAPLDTAAVTIDEATTFSWSPAATADHVCVTADYVFSRPWCCGADDGELAIATAGEPTSAEIVRVWLHPSPAIGAHQIEIRSAFATDVTP